MILNTTRAREHLAKGELRALFIEELGWDRHTATLRVTVAGSTWDLHAVAQKCGMVAYQCPSPVGQALPDYSQRRKIEHLVAKSAHEHLIVFTDPGNQTQVWQWAKREVGKPTVCREHTYHSSQPGDALLQKLSAIACALEEEDQLSLLDVTQRARAGFDVERVTKRFYDRFQKEHTAFLGFITGIDESADREWYASVMLNRLMFVYFVQRKGFLDGDRDYLRNRLTHLRTEHGRDKFYSFYRYFLLRLFHEGLGGRTRTRELEALLGHIPYLNGGLFDVHELEKPDRYGPAIQIPDSAFERIFDFFDEWQWHLDERPLRADDEINPDVLGYIFERYINQKQMGAYYTKEDITEYISKSTIIPLILDAAGSKCRLAFDNSRGPTVWDLLSQNPDHYIFEWIRHGCDIDLPDEIAAGLDTSKPNLIECRRHWSQPAPAEYALPTESWREVVARRQRYEEIRRKLAAGEVCEVNALITNNLDLRQFAQDVIQYCERPDLLNALWQAVTTITILDPTGGSGAFLFAALNILQPLYEGCLERMKNFLVEWQEGGKTAHPNYRNSFTEILDRVSAHPNPNYFVLKSIILNNLYAVDIMEEAVEICKLRLFLKLASQVEPDSARENFGIEPLPDIDFNIRSGNTLVGYATHSEVKHAITRGLDFDNTAELIAVRAADLQQTFDKFRQIQTEADGSVPAAHKLELRKRLNALETELNLHLAGEYGVKVTDKSAYAQWLKSHKPFHWFIHFYGILEKGGFDVIIGNPPYISAARVRREAYTVNNLVTADCSDVYAWVLERGESLLCNNGRSGMIVPLSLSFSSEFDTCRRLLLRAYCTNWFSSFGRIPAALFAADVRVRNTIHIGHKSKSTAKAYTTRLHRWFEVARPMLLQSMEYAPYVPSLWKYRIPKLNTPSLAGTFERALGANKRTIDMNTSKRATQHVLHFKKSAYNWLNFCHSLPPCYEGARRVEHTKFGKIYFHDATTSQLAMLLANGKLMMAFWFAIGDDFDVTRWNFVDFPADLSKLTANDRNALLEIAPKLEQAMHSAVQFKLNAGRRVGNYNLAKCRHITDQSDSILAEAFGFNAAWEDIELYYTQMVKTDFTSLDED